jgi:hypothetical protein
MKAENAEKRRPRSDIKKAGACQLFREAHGWLQSIARNSRVFGNGFEKSNILFRNVNNSLHRRRSSGNSDEWSGKIVTVESRFHDDLEYRGETRMRRERVFI